jgi:hypothetical protein
MHGAKEFFPEHLTRVSRLPMSRNANHDLPLMIISYFHVNGA